MPCTRRDLFALATHAGPGGALLSAADAAPGTLSKDGLRGNGLPA
jgi:hypothetical protein